MTKDKCFACDKILKENYFIVETDDGSSVYVGSECYKKIKKSKDKGYQPKKGGPILFDNLDQWRILGK